MVIIVVVVVIKGQGTAEAQWLLVIAVGFLRSVSAGTHMEESRKASGKNCSRIPPRVPPC